MNTIRCSKLFLAAVILLGSQSCKDLLDEKPISQVPGNYLNTKAGFEDAVEATYSSLRGYYGREAAMTLTVFGTDTYTMGADGSFKFVNQYTSQMDGRLAPTREIWNAFYVAINTANAVIDRADKIPDLDEAIKKRRIAEVKFLRAHHHFLLVQMFGPVPLRLTENTVANKVATRNSVPEVYAGIINDLETALPDLPTTPEAYGRVGKGACEHLLARVYLTKATSEAKAADDYAKAATYAQNVTSKYNYKLLPDFAKVFEQGAGEINDEVIFATQYTSDPLTNGPGNQTHLYFGMEYDVQAGMQRDVLNGRPFKRFMPTDYTLHTVFKDRLNDSRYEKSFKHVYYANRPGTYTNMFDPTKRSLTFANGDTAIYLPGYDPGNPKGLLLPPDANLTTSAITAKRYQVLTPSLYKANLFPALNKFFDPLRPDRTYEQGSRDFIMFRLAETYLILSEALLMQGKTAEAANAINVVRRRAARVGKTPEETETYVKAMEVTPDRLTMEFIMEERERELLGEMFRWFDLKRWGVLVERVKRYNTDGAPNVKEFHNLRPIPQDEIDRTTGGNEAFPQNFGY